MGKPRLKKAPDGIDKDYRFMRALARGLSVLRAFSPGNRPLGNGELSERVGLSKPTVSRITFTLTELGYLEHQESSGEYRLGPGVLSLGYDVMAQLEIRDVARSFMQELADYANGSVYLGALDRLEIVYIEACRAPVSMVIRLGVGSRIPLPTTGMGRAYLAALPEAERAELIDKVAKPYGDAWPAIKVKMEKAINLVEKRGFAMTVGDWVSESNSAGCVIRRPDGYPVYAINVGGLRSIITKERLEADLGPRLVGVARLIEAAARGIF